MSNRSTSFDAGFAFELKTESWSLYAIGMTMIALRTYARIQLNGIRWITLDDKFILVAAGFYTMLIVCLNVIADGGGSNLYAPGTFDTFTQKDIEERIKGSKIVLVSEQAMLNVIYTLKACLLIFYSRLTTGLKQERAVKYLSIAVAIGWISTEFAFFFSCRPFNGYWAVPPPNPQCTTLQHYAITQACFNITTDFLMLAICVPLVFKLNIPWRRKAIVLVVFSMGIFVIIAAILTKIYNLSDVYSTSYMLWYVRESSVAVFIANLPMVWPLVRRWTSMLFPSTTKAKLDPNDANMVFLEGIGRSTLDQWQNANPKNDNVILVSTGDYKNELDMIESGLSSGENDSKMDVQEKEESADMDTMTGRSRSVALERVMKSWGLRRQSTP